MNAAATQAPPILHLSAVVGQPAERRRRRAPGQGRGSDRAARRRRLPADHGFLVTVAGHTLLPRRRARVGHGPRSGVVLRKAKLDLRRFERRPEEVLLKRDLLDRQLINVQGARLVRANEIELALVAGSWRVVGVDTGPRGGLRRLLPKGLGSHIAPASSSTGRASSHSSAMCRRSACASPTPSSPSFIRRRSPTSSRPPRGARARRSSRRSATTTASWRPTSSRSSTTTTSGSSSRIAPTRRSRRSSRGWRPTTPPTSSASSTRSAASR